MEEENKVTVENSENGTPDEKKNNSFLIAGVAIALILIGAVVFAGMQQRKAMVAGDATQVSPVAVQEQVEETDMAEFDSEEEIANQEEDGTGAAGISPAETEADTEEVAAQVITVEGGMFYFKPNVIRVKKGETVKITFNNVEGMHDFVVDEFNVATKKIQGGQSDTVEFTPDQTGSFEFYCSIGAHRANGMKGTLIVE